jgi:predicted RNA-binding Zn-ribbon protein involved in translation (DUF1610 family)
MNIVKKVIKKIKLLIRKLFISERGGPFVDCPICSNKVIPYMFCDTARKHSLDVYIDCKKCGNFQIMG